MSRPELVGLLLLVATAFMLGLVALAWTAIAARLAGLV